MTTVRYAWEGSFRIPTHIFIQHLVFMAVFDWILGWCQFTPPGVPIHPSCANSPRPVVNFIFFNKTKTEVPEVLKCICVELLCIAPTHICYNILAVSMTSLGGDQKKGLPIRPALPYIHASKLSKVPFYLLTCSARDSIMIIALKSISFWECPLNSFPTCPNNLPWHCLWTIHIIICVGLLALWCIFVGMQFLVLN